MNTEEPQPEPSSADARPLASYETSFWAFPEYPVFWIPAIGVTLCMFIGLTVLMVLS